MIKELAKVTSAEIRMEDRGLLCLVIGLDYGGTCQCLQAVLCEYSKQHDERRGTAAGLEYVRRILVAFNVETLDKLKGRVLYALKKDHYGVVEGLEALPFDGGASVLRSEVFS